MFIGNVHERQLPFLEFLQIEGEHRIWAIIFRITFFSSLYM